MPKVCLVIFVTVKIYNRIAGFFRYRSSRLAAPVAMDKEGLALSAVSGKHTKTLSYVNHTTGNFSVFYIDTAFCLCYDKTA